MNDRRDCRRLRLRRYVEWRRDGGRGREGEDHAVVRRELSAVESHDGVHRHRLGGERDEEILVLSIAHLTHPQVDVDKRAAWKRSNIATAQRSRHEKLAFVSPQSVASLFAWLLFH